MPGGDKLRRVFFCRLQDREAWVGRNLLILKRDRRAPMVVIDFHAYARLLHSALRKPQDHRECRNVPRRSCADSSRRPCVSHATADPSGLTHAGRDFVQVITSVPTQGEISMVHPSSRFYRCLCQVLIASMLFQTGCFSGHKTYTHLPTEPPSTIRHWWNPEDGIWRWNYEMNR